MCGIVYARSLTGNNVVDDIIYRYKAQRNRGTEGFGFYLPNTGSLVHSPSEDRIMELLKHEDAPEVLYHHRMPTSTANVENACHPFSTKDFFARRYVLVHNGVVHNPETLKKAHEELGIVYHSVQPDGVKFNDSEALLWDVALYLEGRQEGLKSEGSVAFIVIEHDTSGRARKVHFGRNRNPLKLQLSDTKLTLASEAKWESEAEDIMPNFLHTFTYSSRTLTLKPLEIPIWVYKAPPHDYGQAWQKPTFKKGFHDPTGSATHISPGSAGTVGAATQAPTTVVTTSEQQSLITSDRDFKDLEKSVQELCAELLASTLTYDDALDSLVMRITNVDKRIKNMQALNYMSAKTTHKFVKLMRYRRVLLLTEDYLFDYLQELAELDASQREAIDG